ncbi:septum formation inhibitor-activating ATPase [Mesorhizobium sp. B2-4-8]|uniref:septum formation inhibitor-activating ATPase n=1 Tax=Mesorhizobium sp. B2-4-8 TaxID=2589941 RepID=UPI00112B3C9D|nr:septum formation inhibitor-activating ATPase [Mesorhizobium sp. B2-4-8]TPL29528.1 septum formation inhibitor-activating ATPase [Mesorhizobium sp. B2-4-8]
MAETSLAEMISAASAADGPVFVPPTAPRLGGVDPLGLRQTNFDLMDQVLPGLNNVARHIRPFVIVAWAWRRARHLAEKEDVGKIKVDLLMDFVDRIEVIYAWSQFLLDANADLPGRQVLGPLVRETHYEFGGPAWKKRREERRYSTAFTAAVNYGPGLKSLGWVDRHPVHLEILVPTAAAERALDSFEALIADRLDHPAFSSLGSVSVSSDEVLGWAEAWSFGTVTDAEKEAAADMLFGTLAPIHRRLGGSLMLEAVTNASTADVELVRSTMAGAPSGFTPPTILEETAARWRKLQIRQLFRLTLETLFSWILRQLDERSKTTEELVAAFLEEAGIDPELRTAETWLEAGHLFEVGPTDLMNRITEVLADASRSGLAAVVIDGLTFCIANAPDAGEHFDRQDRLPLFRAKREAAAWEDAPAKQFARHVLETWVLAQHVYWSVGRGLADARARGRFILRLKVVMDEGGWTLAPGVPSAFTPRPTPDRLQTALSLATECDLL